VSEETKPGRISTDADGSLVFTPTVDTKASHGLVLDRDLSFEDVCTATPRLLQAMVTAGWPTERVQMFHAFFTAVQRHEFFSSIDERDQRAILLYQDEQRHAWHNEAATATLANPVYSLAVINERRLNDAWRRVDIEIHDEKRSQVCIDLSVPSFL
jgi:hypothetical protein